MTSRKDLRRLLQEELKIAVDWPGLRHDLETDVGLYSLADLASWAPVLSFDSGHGEVGRALRNEIERIDNLLDDHVVALGRFTDALGADAYPEFVRRVQVILGEQLRIEVPAGYLPVRVDTQTGQIEYVQPSWSMRTRGRDNAQHEREVVDAIAGARS